MKKDEMSNFVERKFDEIWHFLFTNEKICGRMLL